MMAEPCLAPNSSRKPLGWIAIAGTVGALVASWYQVSLGVTIHAFSNTIQVDAFSVLFHYVIAAVVLVTLLGSLDYFEGNASHAGEYFALLCFGAVGMMLMASSVELLMVFVGLEISSISTYILSGFRKGQATGSESSIKYFLLGSFATAFFLYGVALAFGATGSTDLYAIALGLQTTTTPALAFTALALILIGLGFKVSAAPFHVWTPDVYQGAPAPVVGLMSTAPKAAAFAVLLRITFTGFPIYQHRWTVLMWVLAALSMTIGNLGALLQRDVKRMLAYSSIAHAGYLLVAFTGLPVRRHCRCLLLHRHLRRHERRRLRCHHPDQRLRRARPHHRRLHRPRPEASLPRRPVELLPSFARSESPSPAGSSASSTSSPPPSTTATSGWPSSACSTAASPAFTTYACWPRSTPSPAPRAPASTSSAPSAFLQPWAWHLPRPPPSPLVFCPAAPSPSPSTPATPP